MVARVRTSVPRPTAASSTRNAPQNPMVLRSGNAMRAPTAPPLSWTCSTLPASAIEPVIRWKRASDATKTAATPATSRARSSREPHADEREADRRKRKRHEERPHAEEEPECAGETGTDRSGEPEERQGDKCGEHEKRNTPHVIALTCEAVPGSAPGPSSACGRSWPGGRPVQFSWGSLCSAPQPRGSWSAMPSDRTIPHKSARGEPPSARLSARRVTSV